MSVKPQPFPWAEAIGFGLGVLRLAPDAFWAMTPRELAAAMRGAGGRVAATPLARCELDRLMQAFPDSRPDFCPDTRQE